MTLDLDYDRWNMERFEYSDKCFSVNSSAPADGVHSFRISAEGPTLDFLAKGFRDEDRKSRAFLVVFSGAVSEQARDTASAPFFSGIGLAGTTRLPLLSVSDPTLALNRDLTLAWYAGNSSAPDLLDIVARNIDQVATATGLLPVLVGGSGGGFAALNIIARLQSQATAVVWNPQTSIGAYYAAAGHKYLETAYPELSIPADAANSQAQLQDFLDQNIETGRHRLPQINTIDPRHSIIFLQNRSDVFHMSKHAGPWLNNIKFRAIGPNTFQSPQGNIQLFIGDWGKGHAVPPSVFLRKLVSRINADTPLTYIGRRYLSQSEYSSAAAFRWLAIRPPTQNDIAIDSQIEGDNIHLALNISAELGAVSDFEYACYLYSGAQRVAQQWYRPNPHATFKAVQTKEALTAKLYLRDQLGTVKAITKAL